MADFLGDFRNELHRGCPSPDDGDTLAFEIDRFLGPSRGTEGLTLEGVYTFERWRVAGG